MKCKNKQEKKGEKGISVFHIALKCLARAARTVAFKMGWEDNDCSHERVASGLHQGVSNFYTVMENLDEGLRYHVWRGYDLTSDGKPVGPAIPLAGVILGIAEYFERMGWDLGGAVLAQLEYKAREAEAHQKNEAGKC